MRDRDRDLDKFFFQKETAIAECQVRLVFFCTNVINEIDVAC